MRHWRGRQCLFLEEFAPGASCGEELLVVDGLCGGDRCLAEEDGSDVSSANMSPGQVQPGSRSNPDAEDIVDETILRWGMG